MQKRLEAQDLILISDKKQPKSTTAQSLRSTHCALEIPRSIKGRGALQYWRKCILLSSVTLLLLEGCGSTNKLLEGGLIFGVFQTRPMCFEVLPDDCQILHLKTLPTTAGPLCCYGYVVGRLCSLHGGWFISGSCSTHRSLDLGKPHFPVPKGKWLYKFGWLDMSLSVMA